MGREKPRGRRKKRKKARAGRLGPGLKHQLGTIDHGAKVYGSELGARNYGAELGVRVTSTDLPAMSPPRLLRAQELSTMCKLGASNDGVELRVQILKSYLQRHICEFF